MRQATLEKDGLKIRVDISTRPSSVWNKKDYETGRIDRIVVSRDIRAHLDIVDMTQEAAPDANGVSHGMGRDIGRFWYNVPEKIDDYSGEAVLRYIDVNQRAIVTEQEMNRIGQILRMVDEAEAEQRTKQEMGNTSLQ